MRIGFIGLGNMGGPMARNVLKAGHTLVVNDIRKELAAPHLADGAKWADGPTAVAQASDVIFTSLPGPREVEAVALGAGGLLEGAARGSVYVDLSTSSATLIRRIHRIYRERGIDVLDAPVSGGVPGAKSGKLAVLVGGDEAVYTRVKPVLDAIGDKVMRVGEIGCGTIAKLVHNMVSACARMAIAEGMTLGVKAGVTPEALLDALQRSSFGQGRVLKEMIPNIVFPGAFEPANFALKLLRKDVGLATDLAQEYHVPMLIAAVAEQQHEEGLRRGWGERDANPLFCLQEERAGVELRTKARVSSA